MMEKSVWRTSGHGIYSRVERNPYAFCLHHIRMCMETDMTTSIRLTKGQGRERPGGIHVHLRSMVVRWVGSTTKMEQDAPVTPGENEA